MALATNSTPGSIVLGGDLTGNANAPELRPTGVIPGTYDVASFVADAKGRVIQAEIGSLILSGDLLGSFGSNVLSSTGVVPGSYTMSQITVDAGGRLTAADTNTLVFGGDLTGAPGSNALSTTGVTPGTYALASVTLDAKGRVSAASSGITTFSGDVVGAYNTNYLVNTSVTPGAYTLSNITVDAKGRITSASTGSVTLSGTVSGTPSSTELSPTGVVAGAYTLAGFTVDSNGRLSAVSSDGLTFIGDLTGAASTNVLADTAVTPGAYTLSNITVDAKGRITSASTGTLTGDVSGAASAVVLSATGITAGSYTTPTLTVDSRGLVTSISSNTWPGDASYADKGFLKITAQGLSISTGALAGVSASGTSTYGVVKSAASDNISIVGGSVDVGAQIPKLASDNTWTKHQRTQTVYAVASSATANTSVSWDFDTYGAIVVDSTNPGILTINAPTNTLNGDILEIHGVGGTTLSQVSSTGDSPGTIAGGDAAGYAWSGSIFVRASQTIGSGTIETSTDGLSWTTRSLPDGTASLSDFAWNGTIFVGVGTLGTADPYRCYIATSTDGISWTRRTVPVDPNYMGLRYVAWNGSVFITNQVAHYPLTYTAYTLYSSDGITWSTGATIRTDYSVGPSTGELELSHDSIGFGANVVQTASRYDGSVWVPGVAVSTSGTSWTFYEIPEFAGAGARWLCSHASAIYVVDTAGTICSSSDGVTWTFRATLGSNSSLSSAGGIIYLDRGLVPEYYSVDGTTWYAFLGDNTGADKRVFCSIDGIPHSYQHKLLTVGKVQFDASYKFSGSYPTTKQSVSCIKYGATYYCTYNT